MSVNGPRAPSATRLAGSQGPNRDRRDHVGLYQIAIRRNRAPGVEQSDDEGVGRAIGAHSIFLRVPGLLAIVQKAMWGAPVRSRTDPTDRPGWRLYRSSCSPGASVCRPPSCRAPRAIGRRRGGPASLTHPLAPAKETKWGFAGMRSSQSVPRRYAAIRGRSEIRSVPRCDARPIRRVGRSDSRSATSDCASDGFRIRTSFLKKAESRLARWQADTGCGPSDWSTGYQFGFSSRAPIRDDSGFRKPSPREQHSRKGAKVLVNRLSVVKNF